MAKQYDDKDIETFLEGKMDRSKQADFELALISDKNLAKRVDTFKAEKVVMKMLRNEAFLEQFEEWDEETQKKDGKKNFWLLLLTLMLLITGWLFWMYSWSPKEITPIRENEQPKQEIPIDSTRIRDAIQEEKTPLIKKTDQPIASNQNEQYSQLASLHYKETISDLSERGINDTLKQSAYEQAHFLYQAQKYKDALSILTQPDSNQLQLFLYLRACTYYQKGDFNLAQKDFSAFQNFRISPRKKDAEWGEVLSLLQQMPQTKELLFSKLALIKNPDKHHFYQQKAAALYEQLKELEQ